MLLEIIFFCYITISYLFFKYPRLLWKRKISFSICRNISHRGGAAEKLENTLAAFKNAFRCGSDLLELDVHLTKDNVVVVVHDENLFRLTGIDKNVSEFDFEDLPLLKRVLPITYDAGNVCCDSDDRNIPKLEDVFKAFSNVAINIDIKKNNVDLIRETNRLIQKYNREKLTIWGSFQEAVNDQCYKETYVWVLNSEENFHKAFVHQATGVMTDYPHKLSDYLFQNCSKINIAVGGKG